MDAVQQVTEAHAVEIPSTDGPLNITVLMGGPSRERDVSLLSGRAIAEALERIGHYVTRADISPDETSALDEADIDVVFIALHGDFGESGRVQELCERRGLGYIGSPPRPSALALDKADAKQLFRRAGLSTPDWIVVEEHHSPADTARRAEAMGMPVVVKPVDGGSSVDVTIARNAADRDDCLAGLMDTYARAMLEQFVDGRELTVSILDEHVLPVLQIIPPGTFYDKEAKYTDCGTRYVFDHGLDEQTVRAVKADSLMAHRTLNCRDLSRVDLILDDRNVPHLLEVNTIPGFTGHSLLPMAAAKVGISFERLVDGIVAMAAARRPAQCCGLFPAPARRR